MMLHRHFEELKAEEKKPVKTEKLSAEPEAKREADAEEAEKRTASRSRTRR